MTTYSYSRVNSFLTCPAQYHHRYLARTQPPVPEGVELFMGSRFHEVMEELYKAERPAGTPPPTLQELLNQFHENWDRALAVNVKKQKERGFAAPVRITREGLTLEDYRQKAAGFIESYYRKYAPFDQDRTEAIELRVQFKLDGNGQYLMQGYIDRLAVDGDGTLWIHDYKTGAKKITEEEARNEDQLALYMLGLKQHERFKDYPRMRMVWHYVAFEDDAVISDRESDELKVLRNRYVRHIQQIESAKTFNPRTSALCGWCEFLTLCQDGQEAVAARAKRQKGREAPPDPAPSPVPAAAPQTPVIADVPQAPLSRAKGRRKSVPDRDQLSLF